MHRQKEACGNKERSRQEKRNCHIRKGNMKMELEYFVIGVIAGSTILSTLVIHELNKIYDEYEKMLDDIRKTEER